MSGIQYWGGVLQMLVSTLYVFQNSKTSNYYKNICIVENTNQVTARHILVLRTNKCINLLSLDQTEWNALVIHHLLSLYIMLPTNTTLHFLPSTVSSSNSVPMWKLISVVRTVVEVLM